MICNNCGAQIDDNATVCEKCGATQNGGAQNETSQYSSSQYSTPQYSAPVDDNGGFGWGLLGCCIPLVGLILFLVWKDTKPNTAKAAGIGALVSVIIYVVYMLLAVIAGVGVGMAG